MSPRHVPASVTELSRVGLLTSLPGQTLTRLAERMQREEVPAGRTIVAPTPYSRLLPATIMAVTLYGISITTALAVASNVMEESGLQSPRA